MNKREKEVIQAQLDAEKAVLKRLESQYKTALNDINQKVKLFDYEIKQLEEAINADGLDDSARDVLKSQQRSKIYRKQYQEALKGQISGVLDKLHGDEYQTLQQYLTESYEDAFVGVAYDLAGQGIPLIMPIDQAAAVKAIQTDSKISKGLYTSLGVDTNHLKKTISSEVTRGIATGLSYADMARNISNASRAPLSRAKVIARTEAHRIQQASSYDAQSKAKGKGADVVKQWDGTLDGKTRDTHRKLDGQIREVDEPFEMDGKKAMYPGDFGDPAEDCNCRCVSLTRARWALDEDELKTLQERAEFFGLDKTKDFEEFKEKYLKAAEESEHQYGIQYGDRAKAVDWDFVKSKAYEAQYSNITDNPETNKKILATAREVLQHRDGTNYEDMYLFDMEGNVLGSVVDSVSEFGVNYSDDFKKALSDSIENKVKTIALHNHPHGTPPSPDDFKKAYENHYAIGLISGHNGQVYMYVNENFEITNEMADEMAFEIGIMIEGGVDVDRANRMVYDRYGLKYTILEGVEANDHQA